MATVPPVSLDDLKAFMNMSLGASTDDPELSMTLEASTDACEGVVGPILHRTVSERVTVRGRAALVSFARLVSVTSLVEVSGTSYDPAALDVDASGLIRRVGGLPCGRYDAEYTAGMGGTADDIPAAVKLAVMIVASHMWETQRGRQARGGFIPGEGVTPVDQGALIMAGYSLPRRALELLKPYRLAPAIA